MTNPNTSTNIEGLTHLFNILEDAKVNTDWLIEDVLPETETVLMYGPSHSGKTYVALDIGLSVAFGRPWHGYEVPDPQGVIYVASEGRRGLARRVLSWVFHHARHTALDAPFYIFEGDLHLNTAQDGGESMRRLANLQAETEAGLIVIDVLSDMAAGIDENGREFGHAFNLVRSLPCAVLALHHSGKDKSKGARGTSSLRAATDIEIEVSDAPLPNGDGSILMTAIYLKSRKNRNEDPMPDLALDLRKPDDDYPQPVIIGRHLEASDAKGVDPSSQLAKVLDAIVAKGREGCSRTSLAEDLGVSRPTVREHVEKLLTRDFIEETPGGRSKILTATRAGVAAIEGSRRVANPPPGDAMGGSRPPIGAVHPSLPANQEPTIEEILEDLARQEGDDIDLDIEHDGPLDRDAVIRAMLSALGE